MTIKMRNLNSDVTSLLRGMMIGDVWYVDGDKGDDYASGADLKNALRTLLTAVTKPVSGNHDYILCVGAETATASVAITQDDLHIIGIGNGGMANTWNRGFQYTALTAIDAIQPAATADGLEMAGIKVFTSQTSIFCDDAGADGMFFHDMTFTPPGDTTTDATGIVFDLEGKYPVVSDSLFIGLAAAINAAGYGGVVERCVFQSDSSAAAAITLAAASDNFIVKDCAFNLSHASGIAITVAATGDDGFVLNSYFDGTMTVPISAASAADILIAGCYNDVITTLTTSTVFTAITTN